MAESSSFSMEAVVTPEGAVRMCGRFGRAVGGVGGFGGWCGSVLRPARVEPVVGRAPVVAAAACVDVVGIGC